MTQGTNWAEWIPWNVIYAIQTPFPAGIILMVFGNHSVMIIWHCANRGQKYVWSWQAAMEAWLNPNHQESGFVCPCLQGHRTYILRTNSHLTTRIGNKWSSEGSGNKGSSSKGAEIQKAGKGTPDLCCVESIFNPSVFYKGKGLGVTTCSFNSV